MNVKKIIAAVVAVSIIAASGVGIYYAKSNKGIKDDEYYNNISKELINPNADENAKKLYAFLLDCYGKKVLSGQYVNLYDNYSDVKFRVDENDPKSEMTVKKSLELQAVHSVTGKYPAVIGLDFADVETGQTRYTVEQAIEWHNAGGIVTFCWHWSAPSQTEGKRHFYTKETDFNLKKALADKESAEYKGLIADIDAVSARINLLQDAGVPILFRPLHEASGGWFWWGASGADAYRELWDIIYDRMTNEHHLNNIIWVCNAQSSKWYVGDDKCDIIGDDPYYPNSSRLLYENNLANVKRFNKQYKTTDTKIITMSENDFIPDIDTMFEENAPWLFFATWCREFVCVQSDDPETPWLLYPEYSEKYASREELKKAYDDERVYTLDNLPPR